MQFPTHHPDERIRRPCARDWVTLEVGDAQAPLRERSKALEAAWPGRYEMRIAPQGTRFALQVRHRQDD